MLVDTLRHFLCAKTRNITIGGMFLTKSAKLLSLQEGCEDCLCKLHLSSHPTHNIQGRWSQATVAAKCSLKLCPRTHRTRDGNISRVYSSTGQFRPHLNAQ
jgi:hypothetical protein